MGVDAGGTNSGIDAALDRRTGEAQNLAISKVMPGATRPGASIFLNYSALRERGCVIDQQLLAHLSPLTWEHINLTGDYHWRRDGGLRNRKLRPLRSQPIPVGLAP